jgi:hypothetical protein
MTSLMYADEPQVREARPHTFLCAVHTKVCWTNECPHFGVPEFSSAEEAWHVVDTTKDEALHRAACEYLQRNHE